MISMITPLYSDTDGDREILDTIRLHLYACYANVASGVECTREELEHLFETDEGLRAWVTDQAGINPDTLTALTPTGRAIINVCANAWVAKVRGLSGDNTFKLIMAGLKKLVP
jgi:hypothetical protein